MNTTDLMIKMIAGRKPQPIKSKAVKAATAEIKAVYQEIGNSAAELVPLIEQAKQDTEYKRQRYHASKRSNNLDVYMQNKQAVEDAETHLAELIQERNEIIDTALPPDKFKRLVTELVQEYSKYKKDKVQTIAKHLTAACESIIELYDETQNFEAILKELQYNLNSEAGDRIIKEIDIERDLLGHATFTSGTGYLLTAADGLNKIMKRI